LCTLLLRQSAINKEAKGLNKLFYKFNEGFRRFAINYTLGVKGWIKRSPLVVILLICIGVGTVLLFRSKPTGFIPTEDEGRLYVTYEIPEAASTNRSISVLDSMMKIIQATPGVDHFAALGGLNAVTFATKSNSGTIFTQLKPWDQRETKELEMQGVLAELIKRLSVIKEANVVVIPPPAIPGLGQTGGFTFELEQKQTNDDIKAFERVVNTFVATLNKRPEISRAFTFFSAHTPGYQVIVDRDKCKKLGLSLSDVYNTMQTYLGSNYVNDFTIYGRNFHVVAQADTVYRQDIKDMGNYYVRNADGKMIPLSTILSYKVIESAPLISHYNIFRTAEINGNAKPGFSSGQAIQALREVADKTLPEGYGYEFSGLSLQEINSGSSSLYIFSLSILFVFLFLAALYESWAVPFSVLLAVPVGMFGAILTLTFVPSISNNIYAQIGLITLIGLSAKNAILIVEFAKERVDRGIPIISATLEAVKLRLRPILMTSFAFILGVLPLVFATGAGGIARNTIGWTVMGGMLAATSLAIFIVPVLFVVITRLSYSKQKLEELRLKALENSEEENPHVV
jgi:HAE1 family hydrophobic/amphiphilic exporter-1